MLPQFNFIGVTLGVTFIGVGITFGILALPAFFLAYSQVKKSAAKGPTIISLDGKLNSNGMDFFVLILTTWIMSIIVGILAALGLASAGINNVMPKAIIAETIAVYFFAKKSIFNRANKIAIAKAELSQQEK